MKKEQLLNEMRTLANEGKLNRLKMTDIPNLMGKHLQTFYYGYKGQDNADDFIVGDIKSN